MAPQSDPVHYDAPEWNKHMVKRILENDKYAGEDGYPRIVSSDTFRRAAQIRESKTEGHSAHPACVKAIKRKLTCAVCDTAFRVQTSFRGGIRWWHCGNNECGNILKEADTDLECRITDLLNRLISRPELLDMRPKIVPVSLESEQLQNELCRELGKADWDESRAKSLAFDGAAMLIDGGNVADSNLVYAFLKDRGISRLDYIVGTHAHEDHVGGLAGALNYATVGTAYCPVTEFDSKAFNDFVKYLGEQGKTITVPKPGDAFRLGGANAEILAPLRPSDEPNNTSIVLKLSYGDVSFLFTGDAERAEEADILEAGYDVSATVLKVGHHGSETSTSYPFLREIMPEYAVISCGENNSYGHPDDNLLSRLRDAGAIVFRTDMQGTITATSDGRTVTFTTERNTNIQTKPDGDERRPDRLTVRRLANRGSGADR
jgi:competence protein ComEC